MDEPIEETSAESGEICQARLTKEDAQKWLNAPDVKTVKGVRDRVLLALLIGFRQPRNIWEWSKT